MSEPLVICLGTSEEPVPDLDFLPWKTLPLSSGLPLSQTGYPLREDIAKACARMLPEVEAVDPDRPLAVYAQGFAAAAALMLLSRMHRRAACGVLLGALADPLSALGLGSCAMPDTSRPLTDQIHDLAGNSIVDCLQDITCPLLILHGEKDDVIPSAQADELYVLMRTLHPDLPSRLVLFPGSGHTLSKADQAICEREIQDFLCRHFESR